jgi:hypothetical protein
MKQPHNIKVTIIRNGIQLLYGYIQSETTKGYYVSFDKSEQIKEWFAKDSQLVKCTII